MFHVPSLVIRLRIEQKKRPAHLGEGPFASFATEGTLLFFFG